MMDRIRAFYAPFLLAMFVIACAGSGAIADDSVWLVRKSSGDVWMTTSAVQPVSLTDQATLKPGDYIRTGRNGRVLLVRGEETILISPNSVVGLPGETKGGLSTTIVQQAGSILLEVEKRSGKHFEVETPYLVAAVKGTQFRVSVNQYDTSVDVLKGEVEVADNKSGQYALVLPGQTAKVSAQGAGGLSLSGSGTLSPIQNGSPRASSVERVFVPKGGLSAPRSTPNGQQVRALGIERGRASGTNSALRIGSPLGDVKVDVLKVTKGLARADMGSTSSEGRAAEKTMWNSGELTPGNGVGHAYGQGNGNGNANGQGNGNAFGQGNGNAFGYAYGKSKGKGKN